MAIGASPSQAAGPLRPDAAGRRKALLPSWSPCRAGREAHVLGLGMGFLVVLACFIVHLLLCFMYLARGGLAIIVAGQFNQVGDNSSFPKNEAVLVANRNILHV